MDGQVPFFFDSDRVVTASNVLITEIEPVFFDSDKKAATSESVVTSEEEEKKPKYQGATAAWLASRLRTEEIDWALNQLHVWTHARRQNEVNPATITELNLLPLESAGEALREMAGPRRFIRRTRGNQMNLPVQIQSASGVESNYLR